MVGTSGAVRVLWEDNHVTIPWGLWCYRADRRRFVMGGALSNGGDLYEWMRGVLKTGTEQEIETELAAMEADSHGLTVLPFLSGERSTGWVAEARAVITGMSLDTTALEIMRAGLEAVAYRFAAIHELIVQGIEEPETVVGSGVALLRSPAWAQIISDALGKPVIATVETEASSKGAALLALEALGAIERLEEEPDVPGRVYSPDPRRHRIYAAARRRQEEIYGALIKRNNQL
jgi:gluconokinase